MTETILITGAASGLGRAFVQYYAQLPSKPTILALDLKADNFTKDHFGQSTAERMILIEADITNTNLSDRIAPPSPPVSLIIHCAGIRGLVPEIVGSQPGDVAAAETLQVMDSQTMLRTFEINTWGTLNLIQTLLPNIKAASESGVRPKVVILSSRMGSVSANTAGGGYAYRASKAALNAVVKSLSMDVPEATFLLLHPGRVETGLVGWKEEGAISVEESLRDCLRIVSDLKKEDSGRYCDRFGETIAW